jgi:hypothetical protein
VRLSIAIAVRIDFAATTFLAAFAFPGAVTSLQWKQTHQRRHAGLPQHTYRHADTSLRIVISQIEEPLLVIGDPVLEQALAGSQHFCGIIFAADL